MRQVLKDGAWVDGKAEPEGLPEHLRILPGDVVSKDVDDPNRVHQLDAPHIVSSLAKEHHNKQLAGKKKTAGKVLKKLRAPGPGEIAPVTQWYVDVTKMRVIQQMAGLAVAQYEKGLRPDLESPVYLWFPTPNVNQYEIRKGVPPIKRLRPKWLRDIDLRLDLLDPPRSIVDVLKRQGIDIKHEFNERLKHAKEDSRVISLVH